MDNHRIRHIVQRMFLVILVIFVASVFITRVFFNIFEERSITLLQSIMFVMQTYTTTGYGELLPFTSDIMNLYASVQMVLGTGLILFGLATAGGAWMQTHFQEIPPKKAPKHMRNHFIICGYSPLTDSLLDELLKLELPYVIIENNLATVRDLMHRQYNVLLGDPADQQVLESAGLYHANALITTGTDDTNVHIVLEARSLSTIPILVAVENEFQREALELAGATEIVSPKQILGEELARVASSSLNKRLVSDIDQLGDLFVMEFPIGMYCQYTNQTILQSRIREETGVTILGLWENGVFRFVDSPHMVLSEESMVVVLGTQNQLKALDDNMSIHLYATSGTQQRFVVAGYGDVAQRTVQLLAEQQHQVTLIVREPVEDHPYVVGDPTSRTVLKEAGIEEATTFIISAATDEQAIFSVLMSRQMNPQLRIYVRANSHTNVKKLYKAGADFVLSVSKISGNIISRLLTTEPDQIISDVDIQFFQHQVEDQLDLNIIRDSEILRACKCMIIAIKRGDTIIQNPRANTLLKKGDILVLLASSTNMNRFKSLIS